MSDEARLIVELIERSNGSAASSLTNQQPGASNVPGSSLAQDFQNRVSSQGASTGLGQGSSPGPSTTPVTPVEFKQEAAFQPDVQASQQSEEDLAVRLALEAMKTSPVTAREDLIGFGYTPKEADDLISRATNSQQSTQRNQQESQKVEIPGEQTPPDQPAQDLPENTPTEGVDPRVTQFAEQVRRSVQTPQEEFDAYKARLDEALKAGPELGLDQERYDRALQAAQEKLTLRTKQEPVQEVSQFTKSLQEAEATYDAFGGRQISGQLGPIGNAADQVFRSVVRNSSELENLFSTLTGSASMAEKAASTAAQAATSSTIVGAEAVATGVELTAMEGGTTAAGMAGGISLGTAAAVGGVATAAVGLALAANYVISNEAAKATQNVASISPEVATAQANAELRQFQANMRTSEILGDELAKNLDNSSRFWTAVQGLKDNALEPIMKDYNAFWNVVTTGLEGLKTFNDIQRDYIPEYLRNPSTIFGGGLLRGASDLIDTVRGALGVEDKSSFKWFEEQPHIDIPMDGKNQSDDPTKFFLPGIR